VESYFHKHHDTLIALSTFCSLLLTLVLIGVTGFYAWTNHNLFSLSRKQFEADWLPQFSVSIQWEATHHALYADSLRGAVIFHNQGPRNFILKRLEYRASRRFGREGRIPADPVEAALHEGVLIPKESDTPVHFGYPLLPGFVRNHPPHPGECIWSLHLEIDIDDIMGIARYTYRYDDLHGLQKLSVERSTPMNALLGAIRSLTQTMDRMSQ